MAACCSARRLTALWLLLGAVGCYWRPAAGGQQQEETCAEGLAGCAADEPEYFGMLQKLARRVLQQAGPAERESHSGVNLAPADVCESESEAADQEFTDRLLSIPVDAEEQQFDKWVEELCPEVRTHFRKFPYFGSFDDPPGERPLTGFTTRTAAQTVCLFKVFADVAVVADTRLHLAGGSALGALFTGGPIPWDDDADAYIPYDSIPRFLQVVERESRNIHPELKLHCARTDEKGKLWNALKCHAMHGIAIPNTTFTKMKHAPPNYNWPFIDIFATKVDTDTDGTTMVKECDLDGAFKGQTYDVKDYFPMYAYYFGGIYLIGPHPRSMAERYGKITCLMTPWNHRLEKHSGDKVILSCCKLVQKFPFVRRSTDGKSILSNGAEHMLLRPSPVDDLERVKPWKTTPSMRAMWARQAESRGAVSPALTVAFPNLGVADVDNTIADSVRCGKSDGNTSQVREPKVLVYNMQRGREWLLAVASMIDFDIILLNEMDFGMARSDQQHTTRQLAHHLKMNYAWGVEFMDLTTGGKDEHAQSGNLHNFYGLTGNAILSRCPLQDVTISRNPVNVKEKRLGGRMALLARTFFDAVPVVVGSVHKVDGLSDEMRAYIAQNPKSSSAAVIGGGQSWGVCEKLGLKQVDFESQPTWPASCNWSGAGPGDIICSSLSLSAPTETGRPCRVLGGLGTQIGNHAPTWVTLKFDVP